MPFFFYFGPDISDIHISHRRFFLIEKEMSITKQYNTWFHDIFAKDQPYCRISLVRPVALKRGAAAP